MKMSCFKNLLLFGFVLCVVICSVNAQTFKCGECLTNNFRCVDKTKYNLCFGGKAMAEVFTCDAGTICTDTAVICDSQTTATASCTGQISSCPSICKGPFHCISATEFTTCISSGATPPVWSLGAGKKLSCPENQVCSEDLLTLNRICAPQSVLDYMEFKITCNQVQTTPTTPTDPTNTPPQQQYNNICLNSKKTGTYFFERNVADCTTYIYCEVNASTAHLVAMLMKCKAGQFYNAAQGKCVEATKCPQ